MKTDEKLKLRNWRPKLLQQMEFEVEKVENWAIEWALGVVGRGQPFVFYSGDIVIKQSPFLPISFGW